MSDNADDERFFRSLERLPLKPFDREFAENEEEEFLDNLCVILGDYLNPSSAKYWGADYPVFSQLWNDRQEKARYLERAIERTALMVTSCGWDPSPLLWLNDYFSGSKQREVSRVDEVRYLVGRLHLAVCGKATKWLRTYDESATPVESDSLELHSRIFTAFELAVKASWGAVCREISLEEVRLRLAELQVALTDAPPVDGLERDFRLLPFRRARLAIKPASESAIMLEPAFCDSVITREKSFASYHDAALNLASEMAEVLEAEFNSIRQENRLLPEEMCRTASQVPHENLGTEGVYWLRLYSVYEEYRAGMMSEAANLYAPSGVPSVNDGPSGRTALRWTKPMQKKDAARYLNCPVNKKANWINGLIKSEKLRCEAINRQFSKFGLESFPEHLWNELSESPLN